MTVAPLGNRDGYPGILEATVSDCPVLFADGFESRDTSAWSGAGGWEPFVGVQGPDWPQPPGGAR